MSWGNFANAARRLERQLPSLKRSVLQDMAAAESLSEVRMQIAEVRIQVDELRRVGVKGPGPTDGSVLNEVGTALDHLRECLETLGPLLAAMVQREHERRSSSPRQLRDLAQERTKTSNAIATLEDRFSVIFADLRSRGIQASRARQPEVRATVTSRRSQDHEKPA